MDQRFEQALREFLRQHLSINVSVDGDRGWSVYDDRDTISVSVRVELLLDGEEIAAETSTTSI